MKKYFYYIPRKDPVLTVCFIVDHQNMARGIAVRSKDDQHCKKEGRKWAKIRAEAAFFSKMHDLKLSEISVIKKHPLSEMFSSMFASQYITDISNLTDIERFFCKL